MGMRGPGATARRKAAEKLDAEPRALPWEAEGLSRVERVTAFLEFLPITKGPLAGETMRLLPSQREFVENVYGPARDDGRRRVRLAVLSEPRKNGKTGLAAGLALCHLLGPESEPRGECYSAASSREQASILFAEMEAILLAVPEFAARVNVQRFHKTVEVLEGVGAGSTYTALSADARKAHGLSPSFFVYDEYAQAKSRELYDNLVTGMGGRAEPLGLVISTQARDDLHPLSELIDYGVQIQSGAIEDDNFHLTFFAAPEDADIFDPAVWAACNPALGIFRDADDMAESAEKAKRLPTFEAAFRNLYLNQRVDAETRFITASEWNACDGKPDLAALAGRPCYGGLDLGSTRDLTALVLVFPGEAGGLDVLPFFWCPADNLREREERDRVPYTVWAGKGLIEPTPGAATDKAYITARIGELAQTYDIRRINYDRWRIEDLKRNLTEEGIEVPLTEFGQGFKDMGPATDLLERAILARTLRHGGQPILKWMASNAIEVSDPAGNRKLDKNKSREKIDGLVALCMALAAAERWEPEDSPAYLERGLRVLEV